jgi:hypothetical protein
MQEHDIGRFKPGLDNLNQPEGHIIFKDSPDGRTYTYVYQNCGGNSLERRYLEPKSYSKSTVGLLCAILKWWVKACKHFLCFAMLCSVDLLYSIC